MNTLRSIASFLAVILALVGKHALAADPRVVLCHVDETGQVVTINVSIRSQPAHVSHGDTGQRNFFADVDGDGVGAGQPIMACTSPGIGFVEISGDAFPNDGNEVADNDDDGIGDNADTDDDEDGLLDTEELTKGTDPLLADTDGDGVNDRHDVFATDPNRTLTHLIGDLGCEWGDANCNQCVYEVEAAFESLENDYENAGRIRFDGYAYPTEGYILNRINDELPGGTYEHVQSIGRIAGIGNDEYMVFTHSTSSDQSNKQGALAVVRMGAGQNTGGYPFYGMPYGDGPDQNTSNRTVAATFSRNNHPGGLAVLGHYVYIAQWCQDHPDGQPDWCPEWSVPAQGFGFSVYDVGKIGLNADINSSPPDELGYYHVYGEDWIGSSSTASVAAVKQSSGHYLVALGRSGGNQYGFYTATEPDGDFDFINTSTIDLWGENASIVTECRSGLLYMFQIEAYQNDVDKVHLYKLVETDEGVGFEYVKSRSFRCRGDEIDGAGDWCNFDAGAGMYVTPSGQLVLYATDWHQTDAGNIRLVEFW